ncbi:MAG: pyridoxal-dependent decarboxylase, exosortase A system-associated [Rhodospirillales bacterium]
MSAPKPKPAAAPVAPFAVIDGCLAVGGVPLPRLADRVGSTPFFAYDRGLITARIRHLRAMLPDGVALSYAIKANPMPAVVQHLAGLVDGFDVASALEMKTVLDAPVDPRHVSFAGPGKTPAELAQAVAAGIMIHLESETEMATVAAVAKAQGLAARVAVRVNPDFELKSSGMKMGGGPKQFGVDAERVPTMLARIGALGLDFHGFHIFSGSQNLRADSLVETHEKTIALALELAKAAPAPLRHLNIGGGFGIPYFPGDAALDLAPVGAALGPQLARVKAAWPDARVVVELGRYIVGEAGVYVARVVDRKESRGHVYLITDGGLHHQLAASGNFGQVLRRNYPIAVATRMGAAADETVSVVGCLCTPLDLLGDKVALPRAEIGDLIVVFQSGAYGLSASPTAFLSHPAPVEVLV